MQRVREELFAAFPSLVNEELSDSYIEENPDPIWSVPNIPLIRAIPLYMLWCTKYSDEEGQLVFSGTISALNKYARATNKEIPWQDFKFQCNREQAKVVLNFLIWCKDNLTLSYDPDISEDPPF